MKPALYVVAATALLAACESTPVWQKDGADEATRKGDAATCHAKARLAPATRPTPPRSIYASSMVLDADNERLRFEQEEFRNCMDEKGYNSRR